MVDMRLEVILIPVTDVDRAKVFYENVAGFHLDGDHRSEGFRVVQFTPPGSSCSVSFGVGLGIDDSQPIKGMHLVVPDMETAVAELTGRGLDVDPVRHMGPTGWVDGPHPEHQDYATYSGFTDPDGNGWVLQETGHAASGS